MQDVLKIESYSASGNVIFPSINLTFEHETIIGIYTDFAKITHLVAQFLRQQDIYLHFREDGYYEKLTVKEYINFLAGIFQVTEPIDTYIQLVDLEAHLKTKIGKLSTSEKQRLRFVSCFINSKNIIVIEEPFQNIDEYSKKVLIQGLHQLKSTGKRIIILSNNMEDLLISCDSIHRLNSEGLHLVDIKEDQNQSPSNSPHIRFEKIPTKKNEKIILFNPPEIDYIESVEGEVSVIVGGEFYPCSLTLNDLEIKLTPFGFFRCHRSYIVNLQKVREIITWTRNSYSLSLNTKEELIVPLSKSKLVELKRIIGI